MEEKIRLAQKDVRLVREQARIVLTILSDEEVEITQNRQFSLNVIAIVGQDYDGEELFEEVGLWRTKPFRRSEIGRIDRKKKRTCIPARHPHSFLTAKQYELVAPIVFRILQETVDKQVSTWKRGPQNPIWIWSPHFWFSKKDRKLNFSWKPVEWPRGMRFSVRAESFFARDVCWAELNSNTAVQQYLQGMAGAIALCLNRHQSEWKGKRKFIELKGPQQVLEILEAKEKFPKYLLAEVLNYLPGGKNFPFRSEIAQLLDWDGSISHERRMSESAFPDPISRLGDAQIKIVRNKGEFLVFEVFPGK